MPDGLFDNILMVVDEKILGIHTAIPGVITSYSAPRAEVQPSIKLKYANGELVTPPVITDVIVMMPRTAGGSLTLPIAVGDPVLLIFSERSIERWASRGGLVEPGDASHHAMSDAFAIPGAYSFGAGTTGESGAVLKAGNTKVKISGDKVAIGNSVAEVLQEVVAALEATATSNCVNGAPLTKASQIATAAAKIEAIRGVL